jgi:hypothetical protein
MFRRVPVPIIRCYSLYTQQCCMSHRSILIPFDSCIQTYMTYTIVVCTVNNSWWWTEELCETCRISFQNKIWEISASSWFYYKDSSRCTVTCHDAWSLVTMHGHMNVKKQKKFGRETFLCLLPSSLPFLFQTILCLGSLRFFLCALYFTFLLLFHLSNYHIS